MTPNTVLNDSNYVLYCAKFYDNPQCYDVKEFKEDLRRVKYVKKLFTRYEMTDDLKERLILNHIIVLINVFGAEHTVRILFLKVSEKHWQYLKPFCILLDMLPKYLYNIGKEGNVIDTDNISMDLNLVEVLRKI